MSHDLPHDLQSSSTITRLLITHTCLLSRTLRVVLDHSNHAIINTGAVGESNQPMFGPRLQRVKHHSSMLQPWSVLDGVTTLHTTPVEHLISGYSLTQLLGCSSTLLSTWSWQYHHSCIKHSLITIVSTSIKSPRHNPVSILSSPDHRE